MINTIIHGDCEEILLDMTKDSVDIVITSPPYNHLGKSRSKAHGWSTTPGKHSSWFQRIMSSSYDDSMPEDEYQKWLTRIFSFCMSGTKGLVWVNHKTRYRDGKGIHPLSFLPFPLWSEIVWKRNGSVALNCKRFAPSHEFIYGFGRPHYWDDESNKLLSVWDIAASKDEDHPCSFPVTIPERVIMASCPPGGIVLDPFCGIGSTAIAAIRTGRHYIGIDIEPRYCEIARKNIERELAQLELTL